jgi:hypothetical protein
MEPVLDGARADADEGVPAANVAVNTSADVPRASSEEELGNNEGADLSALDSGAAGERKRRGFDLELAESVALEVGARTESGAADVIGHCAPKEPTEDAPYVATAARRGHCAPQHVVLHYLRKWRGAKGAKRPPRVPLRELPFAFMGGLLSVGTLAAINFVCFAEDAPSYEMVIASFGASAVLLYGAPAAVFSQPYNVIGGHVLSALVGVAVRVLIVERGCSDRGESCEWVGAALAVAFSLVLMLATGSTHPPGSATALLAVTGDPVVRALGFMFVLVPVATGASVMVLVALLVMNMDPKRRYPQYWF